MWDFLGQVLGVAIGLSFVYLLLSLMVSTLVESIIAYWIQLRPRLLAASLKAMLQDQNDPNNTNQKLHDAVLKHPMVRGLSDAAQGWFVRQRVSYIPSKEFATALVDVLCPPDPAVPRNDQKILEAVKKLNAPPLGPFLVGLVQDGEAGLEKIRERIAHWFDESQKQVTALYRTYSGFCLMAAALVVVGSLNVDSVRIAQTLWADPLLRASFEKAAADFLEREKATKPEATPAAQPESKSESVRESTGQHDGAAAGLERYKLLRQQVLEQGLPVGWTAAEFAGWKSFPPHEKVGVVVLKIGGLLITAFAISLGAPFWFDLLNKLVNIRAAAGKRPLTEQERKAETT